MSLKKKLIIVCDDDTKKYATYLMQLTSSQDDDEDEVVGIKDGTVDAAIWDEKQYADSQATLNSSTYILFIGNGKVAKTARGNMPSKFDRLGMHYGWLGTQGCMYVEDLSLDRDNYPEFEELCKEYGKDFGDSIGLLEAKPLEATEIPAQNVTIEASVEEEDGGLLDLANKQFAAAQSMVDQASDMLGHLRAAADKAAVRMGALISGREARTRQYTLLTLIMYRDGLQKFLDLS